MNNTIIPEIKFKAIVRFEEEGLKRTESISSSLFNNNKFPKSREYR